LDFHSSGDLADVTALQSELARLNPSTMGIMLKIETRSAFELTDEQMVLLADIASTGFSGAESANICIGDTVAVFAQGPIGLCATVRIEMSKRMGADVVLDPTECDVIAEIKKLTGGGADVAIEVLGLQSTFENALRCLRPGGTLSSLGVYSGQLQVPYDAFAAGIGDYKIVTTLCPGGKERMRRLMSMVQSKRFDPLPLITHSFKLDQIVEISESEERHQEFSANPAPPRRKPVSVLTPQIAAKNNMKRSSRGTGRGNGRLRHVGNGIGFQITDGSSHG